MSRKLILNKVVVVDLRGNADFHSPVDPLWIAVHNSRPIVRMVQVSIGTNYVSYACARVIGMWNVVGCDPQIDVALSGCFIQQVMLKISQNKYGILAPLSQRLLSGSK